MRWRAVVSKMVNVLHAHVWSHHQVFFKCWISEYPIRCYPMPCSSTHLWRWNFFTSLLFRLLFRLPLLYFCEGILVKEKKEWNRVRIRDTHMRILLLCAGTNAVSPSELRDAKDGGVRVYQQQEEFLSRGLNSLNNCRSITPCPGINLHSHCSGSRSVRPTTSIKPK